MCLDAVSTKPVMDDYCIAKRPDPQKRMCNVDCFVKFVFFLGFLGLKFLVGKLGNVSLIIHIKNIAKEELLDFPITTLLCCYESSQMAIIHSF